MNGIQFAIEHPASGLKATASVNGQLLTDLVQGAKVILALAIKTAPIWVPLIVGAGATPKSSE